MTWNENQQKLSNLLEFLKDITYFETNLKFNTCAYSTCLHTVYSIYTKYNHNEKLNVFALTI